MATTVTSQIQGITINEALKAPVRVVTSANITLSGLQTINGVALVEGDRVLVKDQTTGSQNGIYNASTGTWQRSKDFNGNRDAVQGTLVVSNNDTSIYYRLTTANPIVIGTTSLTFEVVSGAVTQGSIGLALYPRTAAEIAAGVTPTNYAKPAVPLKDISRFVTDNTYATDITAAAQDGLDVERNIIWPAGNYKISAALTVRPHTIVQGAGRSDYLINVNPSSSNIENTRIFQSAAAPAFTTEITPLSGAYEGRVRFADLTVQGRINATTFGTYGIRCVGSQRFLAERVHATFFLNSGIYIAASVINDLQDCSATYCEEYGLNLDFAADGQPVSYNAYMTNVIGGTYHQNGDANVRVGNSAVKINFIGVDFESAGNFYPAGDGFGAYLASEARSVTFDGCWFEGNKIHLVVGDEALGSLVTVPKNTNIANCQFWSVSTGTTKIKLNVGTRTRIVNNEFFGGGDILVGNISDNPLIEGNTGNPRVLDANGHILTVDSQDMTNNFPYSDLTAWTLTNCTVAEEFVIGPAGPVPVYKITPSATGLVRLASPEADYSSWFETRQTIGCYIKTDGAVERDLWLAISSVNMPKSYTARETDNFKVFTSWRWWSIGRTLAAADTGNQSFLLDVTVTTTDAFYITGFTSRTGICYKPFTAPFDTFGAIANSATPTVTGLRSARTGGTTTITDLVGGALAQEFTLVAEHSLTITDGTNLFLAGSANFAMNATDTLTLIRKADGNWYETGRSDNT